MSRQYDAKQHALAAYPDDKEKAVDLFLDFIDMGKSDIEYELSETVEQYLFGNDSETDGLTTGP